MNFNKDNLFKNMFDIILEKHIINLMKKIYNFEIIYD